MKLIRWYRLRPLASKLSIVTNTLVVEDSGELELSSNTAILSSLFLDLNGRISSVIFWYDMRI